jgi:hypothetical protein
MPDAQRIDRGLGRKAIEGEHYEASPAAFSCAVPSKGRSIRSAKFSAVSVGGWSPAAIASTISGARKARHGSRLT